ncbi:hypothetical protein F5X96DRAFT_672737 [Biscogniauxia mediterranea]|nr:hypothetical protein F5X96DRAFT_672737 [Biscogniauxia mediterranea]
MATNKKQLLRIITTLHLHKQVSSSDSESDSATRHYDADAADVAAERRRYERCRRRRRGVEALNLEKEAWLGKSGCEGQGKGKGKKVRWADQVKTSPTTAPAIQVAFFIKSDRAVNHTDTFAKAAGTEYAFKRAIDCAKGLAADGFDVLADDKLAKEVWEAETIFRIFAGWYDDLLI